MPKTFNVPPDWPKWNKVCGAKRHHGAGTCSLKAVPGCPRCRYHGSGGKKAAEYGQLRYLAWIVCGQNGPQNIPVEQACRLAFAVYAEMIMNQGKGTTDQMMKAALWLTQLIDT